MDLGAFVQENRRWLIGCGVGGLLYLVGHIVIGSIYDLNGARASLANLGRLSGKDEYYLKPALEAAQAEAEQLQQEHQRLQQELAFVPTAKFQLEGHPDSQEYLFQVGRSVKKALLEAAGERDVQVVEKDVGWPPVTGVDEIRGVLFGLELLEETGKRLFAAHDAVRARDPEAMGLRAIVSLKTDDRRAQKNQMRSSRPGEVDLHDLVVQERVSFQFQCDAATATAFFEACRKPGRTLAVETVQMLQPQRPGDPVVVKGTLQGIAFKAAKEPK